MMNLTGDGNGFDMVTMPPAMARQGADGEFLPAAAAMPTIRSRSATTSSPSCIAATDARMDEESQKAGRQGVGGGVPLIAQPRMAQPAHAKLWRCDAMFGRYACRSLKFVWHGHEAARIHHISLRHGGGLAGAVADCGARSKSSAAKSRAGSQLRVPPPATVGQVATLQGSATVTRGRRAAAALKVSDPIFKNDTLQTSRELLARRHLRRRDDFQPVRRIRASSIDEFVYQEGGSGNAATFNVAVGTAAFVASLVAKTGDMKITTPKCDARHSRHDRRRRSAGSRRGAAAPTIKLYPDADGHVGQIEVFDRQGGRLGTLTQGASAFALRAGAGGRLIARCRTGFRRKRRRATAACCSGSTCRTRSAGRWRSSAGNCARPISSGRTISGRRAARRIVGCREVNKHPPAAGRSAAQSSAAEAGTPRARGQTKPKPTNHACRQTVPSTIQKRRETPCEPINCPRAAPASSRWRRSSVLIPSRAIVRFW